MQILLKQIRMNKKITQLQLAKETKLSVSYIQKLETGRRKMPSYDSALRLADALGVRIEELFLYDNN